MDPIAITILTLIALVFGGTTASSQYKVYREQALRKAMRTKRYITGGYSLSLFDVFWDLGASDYALEMMGKDHLLPATLHDLKMSYSILTERIQQHGSYHEYIEDTLASIETYYREHRLIGSRTQTAQTLQLAAQKGLLPLQQSGTSPTQSRQTSTALTHQPKNHDSYQTMMMSFSLEDRQSLRHHNTSSLPGSLVLSYDPNGQIDFDLDQITGLDVSGILTMLFGGVLTTGLHKWWKMRRLRTLKTTLDQELSALYDLFATHASRGPNFINTLYHGARQWELEANRLETLLNANPAADRTWHLAASILLKDACDLARELTEQAYSTTRRGLETIKYHGSNDNKPMAGYLIYLNQHAFFAGRVPNYASYTNRVEAAAYHIQAELNKLHREGVI